MDNKNTSPKDKALDINVTIPTQPEPKPAE